MTMTTCRSFRIASFFSRFAFTCYTWMLRWFMWGLSLRAQAVYFLSNILKTRSVLDCWASWILSVPIDITEWGSLIQKSESQSALKLEARKFIWLRKYQFYGLTRWLCTDARGYWWESVLSSHHVDPRDRTWIIRLSSRHLNLLSHCGSPSTMFSDVLLGAFTHANQHSRNHLPGHWEENKLNLICSAWGSSVL